MKKNDLQQEYNDLCDRRKNLIAVQKRSEEDFVKHLNESRLDTEFVLRSIDSIDCNGIKTESQAKYLNFIEATETLNACIGAIQNVIFKAREQNFELDLSAYAFKGVFN